MGNSLAENVFGPAGRIVTAVGLGGEGILRSRGRGPHARRVIEEALSQGITYFDSAPAYQESESYFGTVWKENPAARQKVFQASKSAQRDGKSALAELDRTLTRLHTDYLDLWQMHDIRTRRDLEAISGPGGALDAFVRAKKEGRVRYIGVTGHHDPAVLAEAVAEWPVDSVMLPVNPVEELLGGFLTETMKAARKKKVAVIGMKILGASHYILPKFDISAGLLIRYALSHGVTVGIVGCASADEVQALARAGRDRTPLAETEKKHLVSIFRPYSRKLAFYRGVI